MKEELNSAMAKWDRLAAKNLKPLKPYRILIASYAMRGHAAACIEIAGEMARRGCHVLYAIPREGQGWVTGIPNVKYLPWDPVLPSGGLLTDFQLRARASASQSRYWAQGQYIVTASMVETYSCVYASFQELIRQVRPDLVLAHHAAIPAIDAAVAQGVSVAIMTFYLPGFLRGASGLLHLPERLPWLRRRIRDLWVIKLWGAARAHERERRRHSDCLSRSLLFRRHVVLSNMSDSIDEIVSLPPNVYLHGPLRRTPEPLAPDIADWLNSYVDEGVVLVAFGSLVRCSTRQISTLAKGLAACRRPVLWALPLQQQQYLPTLPQRFRIVSFVQQTGVLAHSATRCFVSHVGSNSFAESLYWGKPLLAVPFMLDQPYFAERVRALGVGLQLSPHMMSAESIRDNLLHLLTNSDFSLSAARISRSLQSTPGVAGAVDTLLQLIDSPLPETATPPG